LIALPYIPTLEMWSPKWPEGRGEYGLPVDSKRRLLLVSLVLCLDRSMTAPMLIRANLSLMSASTRLELDSSMPVPQGPIVDMEGISSNLLAAGCGSWMRLLDLMVGEQGNDPNEATYMVRPTSKVPLDSTYHSTTLNLKKWQLRLLPRASTSFTQYCSSLSLSVRSSSADMIRLTIPTQYSASAGQSLNRGLHRGKIVRERRC